MATNRLLQVLAGDKRIKYRDSNDTNLPFQVPVPLHDVDTIHSLSDWFYREFEEIRQQEGKRQPVRGDS